MYNKIIRIHVRIISYFEFYTSCIFYGIPVYFRCLFFFLYF